MCYPKPGPRCSTHATTRLKNAKAALAKVDLANPEEVKQVKVALAKIQEEWLTSPVGIKHLRTKFDETGDVRYKAKADKYALLRKEQLAAYKALNPTENTASTAKPNSKSSVLKPSPKPKSALGKKLDEKKANFNAKIHTAYVENVKLAFINPTPMTKAQVRSGLSPLVCKCGENFTLSEAQNIYGLEWGDIEKVSCSSCRKQIKRLREIDNQVNYESTPFMNIENVKQATWYHTTANPKWLEQMSSLDEPHYVHLGTRDAAMDRNLHDGKPKDYLYEVSFRDDVYIADKIASDDNVWHTKINDDTSREIGGDALRYLNVWEDPGSLSILADPRKLVFRRMDPVNRKDSDEFSLDRKARTYKPSMLDRFTRFLNGKKAA